MNKVIKTTEARLPSTRGTFKLEAFASEFPDFPHLALVKSLDGEVINVRIHSECMTGDVFGSLRCDCGEQLHRSSEYIESNGGVVIYLRQEGRGIGLENKLKAYNLQDQGMDTIQANLALGFHADDRDFTPAIEYLKSKGITKINLLTNNPEKIASFNHSGIKVMKRIPIIVAEDNENAPYLRTKKESMGHMLDS